MTQLADPVNFGSLDCAAERALVARLLRGDREALERVVLASLPTIRQRIRRELARRAGSPVSVLKDDVADAVQQVVLRLLSSGPRILQNWEPERGLSLNGFLGLYAARVASSWARSGRRSGWGERPMPPEFFERAWGEPQDGRMEARAALRAIWDVLTERLDGRSLRLFRAVVVLDQPTDVICREFGMTPNAVYCVRRRYRQLIKELDPGLELTAALPGHAANPRGRGQVGQGRRGAARARSAASAECSDRSGPVAANEL